ncbi:ABC transporter substrate-binding protein [Actinomadura parmotrematis]|uniref:ABC transporter substrate-binding protein n=1 Tax=Actinomadura parmotrematis TaxID=2864039 RepID=A0ABS7FZQ7_9ACTN|nr:ABC transporter substrate-binding protein [Actinomadura parmotrematis]MBW8485741.1 ABC transporter substrate-binding protein [Actinomadura parmotrematis]
MSQPGGAERYAGLLTLFARLRERPTARQGDRLRPLLVVVDPDGSATRELAVGAKTDGPAVHLSADSAASPRSDELPLLLRQISRGLSQGPAALRFPLLSLVLWLVELRLTRIEQEERGDENEPSDEFLKKQWALVKELRRPGEHAEQRQRMERAVRAQRQVIVPAAEPGQRGRLGSALDYIGQIAPIGVAVVALLSATAASAVDLVTALIAAAAGLSVLLGQILGRTRDWSGGRHYRWLTEQRHLRGDPGEGLTGFALALFHDEPRGAARGGSGDPVAELLVDAFLQDLRQSYRRRIWRAAWARVRYPAVVIDAMPADRAAHRFVVLVESVRRAEPRFDPLVIAVGCASASDAAELAGLVRTPVASAEMIGLDRLARPGAAPPFWERSRADRRRANVLGPTRAFLVDATDGDGSSTEPPYRGRRRPWATHPAMPWIAMGAVVAASVAVISFQAVRYCAPFSVWRAGDRECVGLTDGSYVFAGRLAATERRIEKLNDAVLDSGRPYVTIVYLGAMSVDPTTRNPQNDLQSDVHGELVGVALAQQRNNATSGLPHVRVVLANAGSRFRYAAEVAERIRTEAAHDPRIVGVVGFGQSRRQTSEAIAELSKSALPMVGTTNTYDDTGKIDDAARAGGDFSPYYFRLAPPNSRLAEHAAFWARDGETGPPAKGADVFYDTSNDDLYSTDLARDFADYFGKGLPRGSVTMLPYNDPSQVPARVQQACQDAGRIFYYAGRSDEFRLFVDRLANTDCHGTRVVLAGDEVTKYVSDNAADIGSTASIRLFYTPLAAREAWTPEWVGASPLQVFYTSFGPLVDDLVGKDAPANERPSQAHSALGYDAASALMSTAQRIYGEQRSLPSAAAVLSELTEPGGGARAQGASGPLVFGPRATGHAVPDKAVLLATVQPDGKVRMVTVCGRLTSEVAHRERCPKG